VKLFKTILTIKFKCLTRRTLQDREQVSLFDRFIIPKKEFTSERKMRDSTTIFIGSVFGIILVLFSAVLYFDTPYSGYVTKTTSAIPQTPVLNAGTTTQRAFDVGAGQNKLICKTDNDCARDSACLNTFCIRTCMTDTECGRGYICKQRTEGDGINGKYLGSYCSEEKIESAAITGLGIPNFEGLLHPKQGATAYPIFDIIGLPTIIKDLYTKVKKTNDDITIIKATLPLNTCRLVGLEDVQRGQVITKTGNTNPVKNTQCLEPITMFVPQPLKQGSASQNTGTNLYYCCNAIGEQQFAPLLLAIESKYIQGGRLGQLGPFIRILSNQALVSCAVVIGTDEIILRLQDERDDQPGQNRNNILPEPFLFAFYGQGDQFAKPELCRLYKDIYLLGDCNKNEQACKVKDGKINDKALCDQFNENIQKIKPVIRCTSSAGAKVSYQFSVGWGNANNQPTYLTFGSATPITTTSPV